MLETIKNDAYLWKCECPVCESHIHRGSEERIFYCENCGQKLHQRVFSEEEMNAAKFQKEMDEYEDQKERIINGIKTDRS